jgi:hypothetical protein
MNIDTCKVLVASLILLLILFVTLIAYTGARLAAAGRAAAAATEGWATILTPGCIDSITPPVCAPFYAPPGPPLDPRRPPVAGFDEAAAAYATRIVGRLEAYLAGAPGAEGMAMLPGLGQPFLTFIPQDKQALAATWVTPDGKLAVVSIRGTRTMADAVSDLEYSQMVAKSKDPRVRVHWGLEAVYQAAKPGLTAAIPPTVEAIFIAGHSLGAGVAMLYAFDVSASGKLAIEVHGLAVPRVGNQAFAETLASRARTSSLINLADVIPTLAWSYMPNVNTPTKPDGYAHVPPVATFENVKSDIISCHGVHTYFEGLAAHPVIVPRVGRV